MITCKAPPQEATRDATNSTHLGLASINGGFLSLRHLKVEHQKT
jgi:hypothetical protein